MATLFCVTTIRGKLGERYIIKHLKSLPSDSYQVINDVIIPGKFGLTQIDHVVVSRYGIFVIETKNMRGKVYGDAHSKIWKKYSKGRELQFKNPLHQNYGHIKSLQKLLGMPEIYFHNIVVFTDSAQLKFELNGVIFENQLIKEISKYDIPVIDESNLIHIVGQIKKADQKSFFARHRQIKQAKERTKSNADMIYSNICPNCGGQLMVRKGRYGRFYGCSNYPKCRYTKNLSS